MRTAAAPLLVMAAIGACTAEQSEKHGTALKLHCGPDGALVGVTVNGVRTDRAITQEVDSFVQTALAGVREPVHVQASDATPYRCIGAALFTMQHAGIRKIGMVAPRPERNGP
jgi:biopolymer transport protein ExbD